MLPNSTVIVLATYVAQGLLALLLGAVLVGFARVYRRARLRYWAASWWSAALYFIAGALALYAYWRSFAPATRLLFTTVSTVAGYWQLALLLFGAYALIEHRDIARHRLVGALAVCAAFAVAAALAFAQTPDAVAERFFVRVGVRSLATGIAFTTVGLLLWRARREAAVLGRRVLAGTFLVFAAVQLHYFTLALASLFGVRLPAYASYLGFIDFIVAAGIGLGTVVWLLEDESAKAVAALEDAARARGELREREDQLRTIVDNSPSVVLLKDVNGRYLLVNRLFTGLIGLPASQVLGQTDFELYPHDIAEAYRLSDEAALATNDVIQFEQEYTRHGTTRQMLVQKFALRDSTGRPYAVCGITTDLTERRRLEDSLRHAQRMESIGRLAGGVAHDFNNLLTAIIGHVELARGDLPAGHPVQSDLEEIRRASQRAGDLTRQLLAFARRQVVEPRVIDLNELVLGTQTMLRRLIGASIESRVELSTDAWPVRADRGQMEQVLVNLAVNARDAMPHGGVLTVATRRERLRSPLVSADVVVPAGDYTLLEVLDTGIGMPEDVRAHAFEPFFTTKEQGRGTGLGLATCYGIVKQSDGFISVESAPGAGATFRVYLPRAVRAETGASDTTVEQQPATRGSETVLLVEDEPAVRAVSARTLRSAGYHVLEAGDGLEALDVVGSYRGPVDAVVSDLVMPRLGGRQMAERLAAARPGVRVIFTSGYAQETIARDGPTVDPAILLQKPFTPATLLQRVRQTLDASA